MSLRVGIFFLAVGLALGQEQPKINRLILTDGSYELINKYEIKGSRIRFFSSERGAWEEMPASMVDWPATERYARQAAADKQSRVRELGEAEAREGAEMEARTPTVAPGIKLPESGGVFLMDVFQGRPELNRLRQNGADLQRNTGKNILRGIINPIASAKQTVELKGAHAAVQAHTPNPSIYALIEPGDDPATSYGPDKAHVHLRLVRCEEKKGNRIVGALNIAVYGKVKQQAQHVEAKVEPVGGAWVKITPAAPLPRGEYALVELLGKEGMNMFVWDFGVNPAAPANVPALKSDPEETPKPPVLQQRKK